MAGTPSFSRYGAVAKSISLLGISEPPSGDFERLYDLVLQPQRAPTPTYETLAQWVDVGVSLVSGMRTYGGATLAR